MIEFDIMIARSQWWSQNRRGGWRSKYARTSAVKRSARLYARDLLNRRTDQVTDLMAHTAAGGRVHVTAVIHPLTHGRFDPENAAPMVKAILDALTCEHWWPDDDYTHLTGPDYRAGEPSSVRDAYRITLRIEKEA